MTARSERRRLEQRAVGERAAAAGREHELGELCLTMEHEHTRRRPYWGVTAMIFGFLAGIGMLAAFNNGSGASAQVREVLVVVTVALFSGGIALYGSAPPPRIDRIFAYTGGLAQQLATEAGPRVIPWALLDRAVIPYGEPEDGDPYVAGVVLTSLDGTQVAAGGGYSRPCLARLAQQVDQVLVATRRQAAVDQCASGLPVEFGPLTVSRQAITWEGGRQSVSWADVRQVGLTRCEIDLRTGRGRPGRRIRLNEVPDALVALLLIRQLAGWHGVQLVGKPLAVPAAPPTEEGVTAARELLLTETDVSEILGQPVTLSPESLNRMRFFRGDGVHLTVMYLGRGRIAGWNRSSSARRGRPVTGAGGHQAWLAAGDRTIVVTAGTATAKLMIKGLSRERREVALAALGDLVAQRLTGADRQAG